MDNKLLKRQNGRVRGRDTTEGCVCEWMSFVHKLKGCFHTLLIQMNFFLVNYMKKG